MEEIRFVVEQAGCASCAARIGDALAKIATVKEIDVDETADVAAVRVAPSSDLSENAVRLALESASQDSGHEYRLQPGSWLALPA